MNQGHLVAAIEFKSQVGPSFGNNFNNRIEEAVGSALDLWTAFREGALGSSPPPFVGWLFLLEDCERSRAPIHDRSPHFPLLEEFGSSSYAERYDIFCRKAVQEKLYTSACLLLSARSAIETGEYVEVSALSALMTFVTTLAGFAAAEAARSAPAR